MTANKICFSTRVFGNYSFQNKEGYFYYFFWLRERDRSRERERDREREKRGGGRKQEK